ncbi:hypothetical protein PPERSA_01331 [Pseudocohnilembus persalinus]|uniref:Uncharacterized protein n=1 Tax=Pseudocohnilembus persalinus TaxID=266149 RepID=A0A0V0QH00_PSEPJ|nr:hypothetical protein PPERSA_01331 [Pseudocohnilembus persalinus]|eukprot:KRX01428.1 hypothetical protein PPERSA_01331 [Pseudocohnilembus persalinus]
MSAYGELLKLTKKQFNEEILQYSFNQKIIKKLVETREIENERANILIQKTINKYQNYFQQQYQNGEMESSLDFKGKKIINAQKINEIQDELEGKLQTLLNKQLQIQQEEMLYNFKNNQSQQQKQEKNLQQQDIDNQIKQMIFFTDQIEFKQQFEQNDLQNKNEKQQYNQFQNDLDGKIQDIFKQLPNKEPFISQKKYVKTIVQNNSEKQLQLISNQQKQQVSNINSIQKFQSVPVSPQKLQKQERKNQQNMQNNCQNLKVTFQKKQDWFLNQKINELKLKEKFQEHSYSTEKNKTPCGIKTTFNKIVKENFLKDIQSRFLFNEEQFQFLSQKMPDGIYMKMLDWKPKQFQNKSMKYQIKKKKEYEKNYEKIMHNSREHRDMTKLKQNQSYKIKQQSGSASTRTNSVLPYSKRENINNNYEKIQNQFNRSQLQSAKIGQNKFNGFLTDRNSLDNSFNLYHNNSNCVNSFQNKILNQNINQNSAKKQISVQNYFQEFSQSQKKQPQNFYSQIDQAKNQLKQDELQPQQIQKSLQIIVNNNRINDQIIEKQQNGQKKQENEKFYKSDQSKLKNQSNTSSDFFGSFLKSKKINDSEKITLGITNSNHIQQNLKKNINNKLMIYGKNKLNVPKTARSEYSSPVKICSRFSKNNENLKSQTPLRKSFMQQRKQNKNDFFLSQQKENQQEEQNVNQDNKQEKILQLHLSQQNKGKNLNQNNEDSPKRIIYSSSSSIKQNQNLQQGIKLQSQKQQQQKINENENENDNENQEINFVNQQIKSLNCFSDVEEEVDVKQSQKFDVSKQNFFTSQEKFLGSQDEITDFFVIQKSQIFDKDKQIKNFSNKNNKCKSEQNLNCSLILKELNPLNFQQYQTNSARNNYKSEGNIQTSQSLQGKKIVGISQLGDSKNKEQQYEQNKTIQQQKNSLLNSLCKSNDISIIQSPLKKKQNKIQNQRFQSQGKGIINFDNKNQIDSEYINYNLSLSNFNNSRNMNSFSNCNKQKEYNSQNEWTENAFESYDNSCNQNKNLSQNCVNLSQSNKQCSSPNMIRRQTQSFIQNQNQKLNRKTYFQIEQQQLQNQLQDIRMNKSKEQENKQKIQQILQTRIQIVKKQKQDRDMQRSQKSSKIISFKEQDLQKYL